MAGSGYHARPALALRAFVARAVIFGLAPKVTPGCCGGIGRQPPVV
ncbi:MAG: hypothetical protein ABL956_10750 [Hyphomonadaceae bacterium]